MNLPLVNAKQEARFMAATLLVSGALSLAVGLATGAGEEDWVLYPAFALIGLFGVATGRRYRRLSRPPLPGPAEVHSAGRKLLLLIPIGTFVVAFAGLTNDGDVGAIYCAVGLAFAHNYLWLRRLESRYGTVLLRRKGTLAKPLYVVTQKDTAPAQRTSPHAQPEAARRAP